MPRRDGTPKRSELKLESRLVHYQRDMATAPDELAAMTVAFDQVRAEIKRATPDKAEDTIARVKDFLTRTADALARQNQRTRTGTGGVR